MKAARDAAERMARKELIQRGEQTIQELQQVWSQVADRPGSVVSFFGGVCCIEAIPSETEQQRQHISCAVGPGMTQQLTCVLCGAAIRACGWAAQSLTREREARLEEARQEELQAIEARADEVRSTHW